MSALLDRIKASLKLTSDLHELHAGASQRQLREFETEAGWRLPAEWRAFYEFSNGAQLLEGNVNVYPLDGEEFSLIRAATAHRAWEWAVPNELWLAGDNGAEELFGLWLPCATSEVAPVVTTGEIFEPGCLAIAGTSLERFLLQRCAYYLLVCDAPAEALAAISLPVELHTNDPDDATWSAVASWADPARPGRSDDPYKERLEGTDVEKLLGRFS